MSAGIKEKAKALLTLMTVTEKVGQLNQSLYGFQVYQVENGEFTIDDVLKEEVQKYSGLGFLYGLYRSDPWSGRDYRNGLSGEMALKAYNTIQKYVLEHSRLHIPMMMSSESPHGHQALDGYLLPVNLAVGATFDPILYKRASKVCASQLKAMGVDLALVSMLDILRDPRWGRSEECFGEDPYLSSLFAEAAVTGMQEEGLGVIAKHFCAQGETTGGLNGTAARIGDRELHEIHLPVAAACCRAGVKGVMAAYNEIDGEFCHASKKLLTGILREELGFDGVVMSDGCAIDRLNELSGDSVRSGAMALNAGVDIGLWDNCFCRLEEALERKLISMETLDQAVLRVLELKLEAGLFEKPYLDQKGERTADYYEGSFHVKDYQNYPENELLAEESVVLLKNENRSLPIGKAEGKTIAVIGPNANDIYRQIGDYSPEMKAGSCLTVLDGIREAYPDSRILFADGSKPEKAKKIASECDILILVLGGSSSRFAGAVFDDTGAVVEGGDVRMDCGEGVDCSGLELPGDQTELFRELIQIKPDLITVIIAGRPYAIPEIAEKTKTLLYSFYPGPKGGRAIANILAGTVSPSGRLPVSLPRSAGMLPVYYNQKMSRRIMSYYDKPQGPLYSFGDGLGYSKLTYSDWSLQGKDDHGLQVKVTVKNEGSYRECAIPQCYRQFITADFSPRVMELIAVSRSWVEPGEEKEITLDLSDRLDYCWSTDQKYENIGGDYRILIRDRGCLLWETEHRIEK